MLVAQMVTNRELDDLGSVRTFEMPGQFCEEPPYGRAPTLHAKDHGAVLFARWMVWSNGWLNNDGKLIQHQRTPCQTLLAARSIKCEMARNTDLVIRLIELRAPAHRRDRFAPFWKQLFGQRLHGFRR